MNRVHEQCPKIDSEIVLSQTGPKTGRLHSPWPARAPSAQAARLPRPRRAPLLASHAVAARPSPAPAACAPRARPRRARAPATRPARLLRAPRACCAPHAPAARPKRLLRAPRACCHLPHAPAATCPARPSRVLLTQPLVQRAHARACCAQRRVATQLPVLRHRQPCLLPLHLTIQFVLQYKLPYSQPSLAIQ